MQTTERNLIQNVFPLLELNLQERVWEIQTQQLQNTLQEVRAQMATLKRPSRPNS
jgi:hypothetical protein